MRLKALRGCIPVTLHVMLDAREQHAATQRLLVSQWGKTVITLTLNIPGEYKQFPLAEKTFDVAKAELLLRLQHANIPLLHNLETRSIAGPMGYFVVEAAAEAVKPLMVSIEEEHELGRLFDIDVINASGERQHREKYGYSPRPCMLCGNPVWECSRNRTHSAAQLAFMTISAMQVHFNVYYSHHIANLAVRALIYEVSVSPKPGLVDCHNNGSHQDMGLFSFIDSATSLNAHFSSCTYRALVFNGDQKALFAALRIPGIRAEKRMMEITGGANTHKGVIFSMGLLCAAMGYLHQNQQEENVENLMNTCAAMASGVLDELKNSQHKQNRTNGENAYLRYHCQGARGEAAAGFPNVMRHGYPVLRRYLESGASPDEAGVATLMHLLANVEDTNIIARSGRDTLLDIQKRIAKVLASEPNLPELLQLSAQLNEEFIAHNLSPGGCADLLAISFFLYFLFDMQ